MVLPRIINISDTKNAVKDRLGGTLANTQARSEIHSRGPMGQADSTAGAILFLLILKVTISNEPKGVNLESRIVIKQFKPSL